LPFSLNPDLKILIRNVAETMLFAAIGGLTLGLLGMPAGYLSGSIFAVACAAIAGRPMTVPQPMFRVLVVLIGISLGAVVTPETLRGVATYPVSIAVLVVATLAIAVGGSLYLRVVHGWEPLTAFLGAVPGALSQVMALAIEYKADVRAIAIVQTIRIIILAVALPALFAALGLVHNAPVTMTAATFDLSQSGELAILVAASTFVALVAHRLNFPGGLLFGAMITSAVLHGGDILRVTLPWWFTVAVMVAFGAVTGSRFANTTVRLLMKFVTAALGVFLVASAITGAFALLLRLLLDIPIAEVMVAFAPGAVEAMLLLALALSFDPIYVGTHHLARIFFVMLATPVAVRLRTRGRAKGPAVKPTSEVIDD
jgi:membrane AbrB-like protein